MGSDVTQAGYRSRVFLTILFAITMAFVETAIVVYLRDLYYPDGFAFPLKDIHTQHLIVEICRELATLIMLGSVAVIAGRFRWERFGYFIMTFGIWDLFYYLWLKVTLDWPQSLLDWDLLFLIPLPWIAPVLAPMLVALLMAVCGILVIREQGRGKTVHPTALTWILAVAGTIAILITFMKDTAATMSQQMPADFAWTLFILGLVLYVIAFVLVYMKAAKTSGGICTD